MNQFNARKVVYMDAFTLAGVSSLHRVFREAPCPAPPGTPLELAAPMNGWASGQIVIAARGQALRNVRVEATELASVEVDSAPDPDGRYALVPGPAIPAAAVRLSRVHYVEMKAAPAGSIAAPGWYPDPLEPLKPESRFDVEADTVQPVWVTLKVPPEQVTPRHPSLVQRFYKNFKGSVSVTADVDGTEVRQALEIRLRVYKFRLPQRRLLNIWTLLDGGSWDSFYSWMTPMQRFRALERAAYLLAEYGIAPSLVTPPGAGASESDLEYYESFFKRTLELGAPHLQQVTEDAWPVIVKNGWENIAYLYCGSEWPRKDNPAYAELIRSCKEKLPAARVAVAGVAPDEWLVDLVDVWVYRSDVPLDALRERVARGDEAQWYVCCGPEPPYPNLHLDSAPIEARVLGWQLFQYGLTGFYYWQSTMTGLVNTANNDGDSPDDKWPNRPWCVETSDVPYSPNDGLLVYPGPNGEPWSCVRLENLRDGAEDYDCLCVLRDYVSRLKTADVAPVLVERAEQALKINPEVSACRTEYTKDPDVLLRERRRVCGYIEEARVALGELSPL